MLDISPIVFTILAFGAVAAAVFGIGRYVVVQAQMQRRLPVSVASADLLSEQTTGRLQAFIAKHFDERRFGVDNTLRGKLRRDLVRAGFFRNDALNHYIFARMALVFILPALAYILMQAFFSEIPIFLKFGALLVSLVLAIVGADAYLARRQRLLMDGYRRVFPDLLDLLTVCVDAGLSLEASLDRVTGEIAKQNRELGLNLLMVT